MKITLYFNVINSAKFKKLRSQNWCELIFIFKLSHSDFFLANIYLQRNFQKSFYGFCNIQTKLCWNFKKWCLVLLRKSRTIFSFDLPSDSRSHLFPMTTMGRSPGDSCCISLCIRWTTCFNSLKELSHVIEYMAINASPILSCTSLVIEYSSPGAVSRILISICLLFLVTSLM